MVRKFGALLAGLAVVVVCVAVNAADEKKLSIKEVMGVVKGKDGLCAKCNAAGKDAKWEDAAKVSKKLVEAGEALAKNECPKGDAKSWEKLTKQYVEQTKAIDKSVADKDSKAFGTAIKAFTDACTPCHKAHK